MEVRQLTIGIALIVVVIVEAAGQPEREPGNQAALLDAVAAVGKAPLR